VLSPNIVASCEDFGARLLLSLPTTKERGTEERGKPKPTRLLSPPLLHPMEKGVASVAAMPRYALASWYIVPGRIFHRRFIVWQNVPLGRAPTPRVA